MNTYTFALQLHVHLDVEAVSIGKAKAVIDRTFPDGEATSVPLKKRCKFIRLDGASGIKAMIAMPSNSTIVLTEVDGEETSELVFTLK